MKSGRTHLMDAVPVTLGQEFGGYAAQVRQGVARIEGTLERLGQIPLGGTATGTGLNTHPEFAERVRARLAEETGLVISPPADPFESQAARDALVETSGALKTVAVSLTKIANDLRLMGSGPRAGLAELRLPELQKGSSIMPGKVNPVIPEVVTQVSAQVIGNDAAITVGGLQGHFELNVFIPLMARNLLESIRLLASASRLFAEKCVDGIEANEPQLTEYAELTLSAATALNPFIGYDLATEIVKEAATSGRSLREVARDKGVDEAVLDEALDYPCDGAAARQELAGSLSFQAGSRTFRPLSESRKHPFVPPMGLAGCPLRYRHKEGNADPQRQAPRPRRSRIPRLPAARRSFDQDRRRRAECGVPGQRQRATRPCSGRRHRARAAPRW